MCYIHICLKVDLDFQKYQLILPSRALVWYVVSKPGLQIALCRIDYLALTQRFQIQKSFYAGITARRKDQGDSSRKQRALWQVFCFHRQCFAFPFPFSFLPMSFLLQNDLSPGQVRLLFTSFCCLPGLMEVGRTQTYCDELCW